MINTNHIDRIMELKAALEMALHQLDKVADDNWIDRATEDEVKTLDDVLNQGYKTLHQS